MPTAARTIGGPGAGKTYRAMEIMELCLGKLRIDPFEFGFVSFTRAARDEAVKRAAELLRIKEADLRKDGFFRTLHSIAYRALRVADGELITAGAGDTQWLRDALQDDEASFSSKRAADPDDDYLPAVARTTCAERSLAMWDAARNRLVSIDVVHAEVACVDDRVPCLDDTIQTIQLYEEAKKKTERLDFTDLLLRFCGKKYDGSPTRPLQDCTPQCSCPVLPVWCHDEMQDCSKLTAAVFRRLAEESDFVYLFGDDHQAIFSFCGGDGSIFADWPVAKEEILPVSRRCRSNILDIADSIIHRSYPARAFRSENGGGEVVRTHIERAISSLEPSDDVLVLARTNAQARELTNLLDDLLLPWKPTKGNGGFNAPAKMEGVRALIDLECGMAIDIKGVKRVLELLPSQIDGDWIFKKGSKKKANERDYPDGLTATAQTLERFGATEQGKELIFSGKYRNLLSGIARKMHDMVMKRDVDVLRAPTIRVGTIHCSPPDEPVLTNHGYISMGDIEFPRVRVAGYRLKNNTLTWGEFVGRGSRGAENRGFAFSMSKRGYIGDLLTLETDASRTRVTPNHQLEVRFADNMLGRYVVYLMRRGAWWRIGTTSTGKRPYISTGVSMRLSAELADGAWILGVFPTKEEARWNEDRLAALYGIPQTTFEVPTTQECRISKNDLHRLHDSLCPTIGEHARALLAAWGYSEEWPLYTRRLARGDYLKMNKFFCGTSLIRAANFLPGYMLLPTADDAFARRLPATNGAGKNYRHNPVWLPAKMHRDRYSGVVCDLSVPPWEHYVSGGAVVHNSSKGQEADHVILLNSLPQPTVYAMEEKAGLDEERRVWYVGCSRARHKLTIASGGPNPFPDL